MRDAVKQGSPGAQFCVGACYMQGECGLPMNRQCAEIYMKAAAAPRLGFTEHSHEHNSAYVL